MTEKATIQSIDEYIAQQAPEVQELLQSIRKVIKEAAPEAKEKISYAIPTFEQHGNLVHFAAFKKHIGFYPTPGGITAFDAELKEYPQSKGGVQFPYQKPIPYDLIRRIVEYRVQSNIELAQAKMLKKKKAASTTSPKVK